MRRRGRSRRPAAAWRRWLPLLALVLAALSGALRANQPGRSVATRPPAHAVARDPANQAVETVAGELASQTAVTETVVKRAIDGDTIELTDGRRVRYIGIDTPELRRRDGGRWVEDPEPFGREAFAENRRLVEGRAVRLEYDVQGKDRYGRSLAYVYVGDEFVNLALVAAGFAQPLTVPPNVKYAERFREASRQARNARRGLWATRRTSKPKATVPSP